MTGGDEIKAVSRRVTDWAIAAHMRTELARGNLDPVGVQPADWGRSGWPRRRCSLW